MSLAFNGLRDTVRSRRIEKTHILRPWILQPTLSDHHWGIDAARLVADLRKAPKYVPITDYAYDCHTAAGRK